MLESETPDRRRIVVPHPLLLGVEPHPLTNDLFGRAGGAPDCEGAFEAHGEDSFGFKFPRAGAEGVSLVGRGV